MAKKLNIAILGSGNIGTDLLVKSLRSPHLNCVKFIGRNLSSPGMKKATSLGVTVSDQSIEALKSDPQSCDLVFDCTSAKFHLEYAPIFKELGIRAIDMTPSQVGKMCIPALNLEESFNQDNINMITCGGQTSIPIANALSRAVPEIEYIEVVSSIASRSAGPGTRANIGEYIDNTESGLRAFTNCQNVKAILNLNPAQPCIDMQTTIFAKTDQADMDRVNEYVNSMVETMKKYVPGYELIIPPVFENGRIAVLVKVRGLGDYLPQYAGNLDIINCAAIAAAEEYARSL